MTKPFTVVGYWIDSMQRFATHIDALGPDEAENACIQAYAGVAICGVFAGRQQSIETTEYVRDSTQ